MTPHDPFAPAGHRLVWADEFDADALDLSTWGPWENAGKFAGQAWCESVTDLHDTRCYTMADSILTIQVPQPAEGTRTPVPAAITTQASMCFSHGYACLRARFDRTRDGAWGAWWTNTKQPGVVYTPSYTTENDIYEGYYWQTGWQANSNTVSTIHKWHTDGGGVEAKTYKGSSRPDDGQWHVYGLLWTPDRLEITQDGIRRGYIDLATGFGRGGMTGFHDPAWILLDMWPRDQATTRRLSLDIDYIRIYQDPTDPDQRLWHNQGVTIAR